MSRMIECVPNFSEGREAAVLAALVDALGAFPVHVLDVQQDPHHHRSVITFAGTPEAVSDAMLAAARVAVEHISLERHRGVHPRIGAVDVVPFVPVHGMTLEECALTARAFAARAADSLQVPVYLYEAAALRPERRSLPAVRGQGYEWLKEVLGRDPAVEPDFGPSQIGPAGAMIVGARRPLVAFNLYLNTGDLQAAQAIARAVRERDGGLPGVRALGLMVGGHAQVSCNLVDFRQTTLTRLVEAVRREARARGVAVLRSELVGLAPRAALLAAASEALGLPSEAAYASVEERIGAAVGDFSPMSFE